MSPFRTAAFLSLLLFAVAARAAPTRSGSEASPDGVSVTLPVPVSESFLLSMPQVGFTGPFAFDWQAWPNLWVGAALGVTSTTDQAGNARSTTGAFLIGPRVGYALGLGPVTLVPRLGLDASFTSSGNIWAVELALPVYARVGPVLVGPSLNYVQPFGDVVRSSLGLVLSAGVVL